MSSETPAYRLNDVQISLGRKMATVTLQGAPGTHVIATFRFDPPGEQTETELRNLALDDAKRHLQAALAAL